MVGFLMTALLGYLLGSFPSAYIAGRLVGVDIRRHGSGNVGATNAWRVLGWKAGIAVGILDILKGYLSVALIPRIPLGTEVDPLYLGIAGGASALLGHVFPVWLGFKGGKGVATGTGVLLGLMPLPMAAAALVFAAAALTTRTVSVGSLSAVASLPLATYLLDRFTPLEYPRPLFWLALALAAFVTWTHRSNIRRLVRGQELSFGGRGRRS